MINIYSYFYAIKPPPLELPAAVGKNILSLSMPHSFFPVSSVLVAITVKVSSEAMEAPVQPLSSIYDLIIYKVHP
jgi:hypothetical protein